MSTRDDRRPFKLALMSVLVVLASPGCTNNDSAAKQDGPPSSAAAAAKPADSVATELKDEARKMLTAYKARDLTTLAQILGDPKMADWERTEPERFVSMFGADSWRWKAVQAWTGEFQQVRVKDKMAQVQFGTIGPDEVAVVTFKKSDKGWRMNDVHSPSRSSFDTWGEPAP